MLLTIAAAAAAGTGYPSLPLLVDAKSGTVVVAKLAAGELRLTSQSPSTVFVNFYFDVNRNGVVEMGSDLFFGPKSTNKLCVSNWTAVNRKTDCGVGTGARIEIGSSDGKVLRTIRIPIREISNSTREVAMKIEAYDSVAKKAHIENVSVDFAASNTRDWAMRDSGTAAASRQSAPPATPQAAPKPAPALRSNLILADFAGHRLALGKPIAITRTMVRHESAKLFRPYVFEFNLNGRKGDRFKLSWAGTVPTVMHAPYDGSVSGQYKPGARIDDLSSWVIYTMNRDGEVSFTFEQIGAVAPPGQTTGMVPSFKNLSPRDYRPITFEVTPVR